MGARKNGTCKGDMRGKSLRRAPRSSLPPTRVLSRIYCLLPSGRRPKLPRRVRWHGPPEIFWNEYALRCNLLHFETILRNVAVCALTSSRKDDFSDIVTIFCNVNNIFWGEARHFFGGRGGKAQPDNGLYHCTWPTRLLKANKIYPSKIPWWYWLTKWIRIATIKPSDFCWDMMRVSLRRKRLLSAQVRHESWK